MKKVCKGKNKKNCWSYSYDKPYFDETILKQEAFILIIVLVRLFDP